MRLLSCSVPPPLLRFAPAVGLLVLCAAGASATETRVRSLGGDGDYFEDLANVPRWYGSLPSYANTAILELGEFDARAGDSARDRQAVRQGAGALFDLDAARRYGTLGLYLFRDAEAADGPGARILMYGKAWAHAQAGLVVGNRTEAAADTAAADALWQRLQETLVGLGVRLDLGEVSYLDVAADWRGSALEAGEASWPGLDDHARTSYSLRARAFYGPRREWALVPVCAYRRDDRWQSGERSGDPVRQAAWQARYGLGLNLFPTGDLMGLVSCEYRRGVDEHYAPDRGGDYLVERLTCSLLVARLGLEARLRPWLSLRAGVHSTPDYRLSAPTPYFGLTDDFDLTLGCALHLGDLDADFLFNDDAPFNLGSLVTNAGEGEASTFSSVSLAYRF
ncbi:MAG: hypothetical protein ACYDIE_05570 [Candidatus Krumholzibacteriia bacterium]